MTTLAAISTLVAKDLRIEARTRQTAALVSVTSLLIVAVLGLALAPAGAGPAGVAAALWAAYLFGGLLCVERTIAVERQDRAVALLLLAPIDRSAVFAAKLITNFALMLGSACIVTPIAMLSFGVDLLATPPAFPLVTLLGLAGLAAVATLFSGVAASSRPRSGLLAVLVLPLSLPIVLASTHETLCLLDPSRHTGGPGLPILVAFDVVFIAAGWLLFETILEP